jgi:demethylmenaquinone methyltransferase/2-methoxy-6-polyprenyl-1,4-benzoquinol methylase
MFDIKNKMQEQIIGAPITSKKAQRLYDFLSPFYEYITRYENIVKDKGLKVAEIKHGSIVLDAAVGTGQTLLASSQHIGKDGIICGIDLSLKMLKTSRKRVQEASSTPHVYLTLGDARQLPYQEEVFDVVFNSYMLDLIDTPEILHVLTEFKRVLKPGGRLVIVSLSKGDRWHSNMKLYEWIYSKCPTLLGGCRPIFSRPFIEELGFQNINREFVLVGRVMPSEIVWGDKPEA